MDEVESMPANPKIVKFGTKGIYPEIVEKLDALFFGAVVRGDDMWAPSSERSPQRFFQASSTQKSCLADTSNAPTDVEELPVDSSIPNGNMSIENEDVEGINYDSDVDENPVRKRNNKLPSTQKKKQGRTKPKGGASMLSAKINDIKEGIENHKNAIMARINKLPPTISDAVEVLISMEDDVPPCSPLYRFATKLLLKKEKRDMFMALKIYFTRLWYLKAEEGEAEASEARTFSNLLGNN